MSLARLMAMAWRQNLLVSVLVELTYRCNLDCFFCYNDLGLKGEPLSREQYFRFFDELRDLEVLHLTLSGGEPLAHPDFLALGARARELGFVVRIKSNGHALRGELARRIRDEIDPFVIEVSLHGATATAHDRQTRVPGSFERLLANLAELQTLQPRRRLGPAAPGRPRGDAAGRRRPRAPGGGALARRRAAPLPRADGARPRARRGSGSRGRPQRRRGRPGAGGQALRRRLLGACRRSLR
jgi:hypothetical protein